MESAEHAFDDIEVDGTYSHDYVITQQIYRCLTESFGDVSPLHVNIEYALSLGFKEVVMHGTILNGFLSHFIGMYFPGRRSILLTTNIRHLKPSYLNDKIQIQAKVLTKVETLKVVELQVKFHNQTQNVVVANGKVQVAVKDGN